MRKAYINLFVFFFGMTTAVVFAFRHRLLAELTQVVSAPSLAKSTASAENASARGRLADKEERFLHASKERAELRTAFSKAKRLELLSQSMRDGSLDALQLIRPQYISFLPEYRNELLPRLKLEGLFQLRSRFDERDWLDWPSSPLSADGGPTEARIYVDNVRLVHPELGRYLETAAQLFHGMYLSILSGSNYSLSEDLYMVLQGAEKILALRKHTAVPARLMLDPTIIEDIAFLEAVENLRGDLFLLYQKREPEALKTQLRLARDLQPAHCAPDVAEGIKQLLRKLALETSAGFREEIFPELLEQQSLLNFAASDEDIRQGLAEFYVITALDALEAGDTERATGLLELSVTTKSGLKAQKVLQHYLAAESRQLEAGGESTMVPSSPQTERFGARLRPQKGQGWAAVLVKLVIFVLLLAGTVGTLLYVRHRRELKLGKAQALRGEQPSAAGVMTPPDALTFDDIFEPEIQTAGPSVAAQG